MRFRDAAAAFDASEKKASTFDIPLQIDLDGKPFAVRFRVISKSSEVRACDQAAEQFVKDFATARLDVNVPEPVRAMIPLDKKTANEVFALIGKLQFTQIGIVDLEIRDGEVVAETLTDEKVTDEEWLWLADRQAWNFKLVKEQWSVAQVTQRAQSLLAEVEDEGKSLPPATTTAGSSAPPFGSGDEHQSS